MSPIAILLVGSLLCLSFDVARLYGIAGLALLFYVYPSLLVGLLILGAMFLLFSHYQK